MSVACQPTKHKQLAILDAVRLRKKLIKEKVILDQIQTSKHTVNFKSNAQTIL